MPNTNVLGKYEMVRLHQCGHGVDDGELNDRYASLIDAGAVCISSKNVIQAPEPHQKAKDARGKHMSPRNTKPAEIIPLYMENLPPSWTLFWRILQVGSGGYLKCFFVNAWWSVFCGFLMAVPFFDAVLAPHTGFR